MPWMMVTNATVYPDTRALHVWKMSMSVWKIPVSVRMVEHVTTDTDPTCAFVHESTLVGAVKSFTSPASPPPAGMGAPAASLGVLVTSVYVS